MYRYRAKDVIANKVITKIIKSFKAEEVPRFSKLEDYFNVKNDIVNRSPKDGKPNNKLAHGFAKYITKMSTGYFMGKPVRYIVPKEDGGDEYKNMLYEILDNNYTDSNNFELAKEASKKGISYELLYIDEKSRLRSKKMNAEEIIPIYSPNVGEFLEAAIRIWSEKDADGKTSDRAALYTDREIYYYMRPANSEEYKFIDAKYHKLSDIPIIVYWNNEEQTGDYEGVISLIDAYDRAQSDTANDSEYFADAYLTITGALGGADGDDEENPYKTMRRERVLELDEQGQAKFLVKDVNDTAQENFKNRLYQDIFFISQVPAMSDESFAGNLTGVAIRYKLIGLDELTTEKEHKFLSAQKKKIRIITDFINAVHHKNFNADVVEIKTQRNFIDNTAEAIEQAKNLEGIVSRETQLERLPFVEDISEEISRLDAKQEDDYNNPYLGLGGMN